MNRRYNINSSFSHPVYPDNEERFIWPLIPFLGGAAIGYFAGRPQYTYPSYYPVYYPYQLPYYNNNIQQVPYNTNY